MWAEVNGDAAFSGYLFYFPSDIFFTASTSYGKGK